MSKLQDEILTVPKMSGSVETPKPLSGNLGAKTINIGGKGDDGATFIPSVSPDGVISWTNNQDLPNPEPVNIKGADGFSPSVAVSDIDGGHRVTITDKDGEKAFDVMDGKDGEGGSGGAQADWNATEGEPGHVLNRTHYEVPTVYDITWDGDMTGRAALPLDNFGLSGGYLVKVSDKVYTKEELVGKWLRASNGEDFHFSHTDEFIDPAPGGFAHSTMGLAVLYSADQFNQAVGVPVGYFTNGTYFLWQGGIYATSLFTEGYIVKMDEKYIPDEFVRSITIDGECPKCILDNGWYAYDYEIVAGNPWYEVSFRENLRVKAGISVATKDNPDAGKVCKCVFESGENDVCSAYTTFGDSVIQVFMKVTFGTIFVSAKTVPDGKPLTDADMDNITAAVLSALPIYNGEVEEV